MQKYFSVLLTDVLDFMTLKNRLLSTVVGVSDTGVFIITGFDKNKLKFLFVPIRQLAGGFQFFFWTSRVFFFFF